MFDCVKLLLAKNLSWACRLLEFNLHRPVDFQDNTPLTAGENVSYEFGAARKRVVAGPRFINEAFHWIWSPFLVKDKGLPLSAY